jgi:pimeloyl-ACP methyl ester carboxylesterase
VVNVVAFCHRYSDSLHIDTANIVLFGHSMGGWVCLEALTRLPSVKKGFALSTWNIGLDFKKVMNAKERSDLIAKSGNSTKYFVLNTSLSDLFGPVMTHPEQYEPATHAALLAKKSIVMLDEHHRNEEIATAIRAQHPADFDYEVWNTDHPFSNKRVSLMNKVLAFLEK